MFTNKYLVAATIFQVSFNSLILWEPIPVYEIHLPSLWTPWWMPPALCLWEELCKDQCLHRYSMMPICPWDIEGTWSTVILFSYYVRTLWKDRPWFSQKTASNFPCSVRCKVVPQEGAHWKIVLFAFVLSAS